ncbi:MAG TPA: hypothetical protein VF020_07190 [Chthoniobacterales bacterium]
MSTPGQNQQEGGEPLVNVIPGAGARNESSGLGRIFQRCLRKRENSERPDGQRNVHGRGQSEKDLISGDSASSEEKLSLRLERMPERSAMSGSPAAKRELLPA